MANEIVTPAPGGGAVKAMVDPLAGAGANTSPDPRGLAAAVGAYALWGLLPLYLKQLGSTPPVEVLAHRALWSILFVGAPLLLAGRLGGALAALRQPRILAVLTLSATLMAANWLVYIWAVSVERVLDASLAYFIGPLVNVVVGRFALGESLTRGQWIAVGLAAAGVVNQTAATGGLPVVSLFLALSFVVYGLLRRRLPVAAGQGLLIETLVMAPVMVTILLVAAPDGGAFMSGDPVLSGLLVLAGAVTAAPLVLYAVAAGRIRFSTLGILQFIGPSLQFMVALAYGERVAAASWATFGLIWVALIVFTIDGLTQERARARLSANLKAQTQGQPTQGQSTQGQSTGGQPTT